MRKNQVAHTLACIALAIASMAVSPARADVAVGTSTGDFLGFEVGASSAGLAGANTSVASGASSQFWNPSLLATMTRPQASMMHATWLQNLQYEWLGYARPMGRQGVGAASVAYFHMPSISGVDEFDNPTGDFRVYDMAVTLGYARPLMRGFMVGANVKAIRQTLATVSGTGAAVDFGASARIAGATLGATVQNLGPDLSLGSGSYPLPQLARFGISRPFLAGDRVLLAVDYTMPKTYYNDLRVGTEVRANSFLALRLGYRRVGGNSDDPSTGLSLGLGAHYGPINIDYAMTPDNGFADIHRLSFGYTFGGGEERPEKRPEPPKHEPVRPPAPKGPPVIVTAPAPAPKKAEPEPKPVETVAQAPVTKEAAPEPKPEMKAEVKPTPKPSGGDQYEVVLGSYQNETGAQSELQALRILGFALKDAKVQYMPGNGYRLSLVRFNSRKSADDLAASLTALSFAPRVEIARR